MGEALITRRGGGMPKGGTLTAFEEENHADASWDFATTAGHQIFGITVNAETTADNFFAGGHTGVKFMVFGFNNPVEITPNNRNVIIWAELDGNIAKVYAKAKTEADAFTSRYKTFGGFYKEG